MLKKKKNWNASFSYSCEPDTLASWLINDYNDFILYSSQQWRRNILRRHLTCLVTQNVACWRGKPWWSIVGHY